MAPVFRLQFRPGSRLTPVPSDTSQADLVTPSLSISASGYPSAFHQDGPAPGPWPGRQPPPSAPQAESSASLHRSRPQEVQSPRCAVGKLGGNPPSTLPSPSETRRPRALPASPGAKQQTVRREPRLHWKRLPRKERMHPTAGCAIYNSKIWTPPRAHRGRADQKPRHLPRNATQPHTEGPLTLPDSREAPGDQAKERAMGEKQASQAL